MVLNKPGRITKAKTFNLKDYLFKNFQNKKEISKMLKIFFN